ncbi:hypothetical protein OAP25_02260 [Flavobacteriaceae bacterium]|nr:hypothetical protein [Flavobacteriaceae bacterium]
MKFRYIGDVEGFSFRGYKFPINEPVEVKEQDVINKLSNNSHYSEVKTRKTKAVEDGNSGRNTE